MNEIIVVNIRPPQGIVYIYIWLWKSSFMVEYSLTDTKTILTVAADSMASGKNDTANMLLV
jgi:hypothetical protein